MLGDVPRPWLATTLSEPDLDAALDEVTTLIKAGFDLLRVEIPINREQADRLTGAGRHVPEWRPREQPWVDGQDPVPAGSQRALAVLRAAVDQAAAERQAYIRLASVAPSLGAPESAFVAAFERIDMIGSDVMAEIVTDGVEPERALADHAFAHQLARGPGRACSSARARSSSHPTSRPGPSDPADEGRPCPRAATPWGDARAGRRPSRRVRSWSARCRDG